MSIFFELNATIPRYLMNIKTFFRRINHSPYSFIILYFVTTILFAAIYYNIPSINASFSNPPSNFFQSLYFSIVTITTLGYGDIYPTSHASQILASSEAVFGLALIGLFLNSIAQRSYNQRKRAIEISNIYWLENIRSHQISAIRALTKNKLSVNEVKSKIFTIEDMRKYLEDINMSDQISSVDKRSIGYCVANDLRFIQKGIANIIAHVDFIEPTLVDIMLRPDGSYSTIVQKIEIWHERLSIVESAKRFEGHGYKEKNIREFDVLFYELSEMYRDITNYLRINLYHHPLSIAVNLNESIHVERDYKNTIRHAKLLLNDPNYKNFASLSLFVAYWETDCKKKAKWILKKSMILNGIDEYDLSGILELKYKIKISEETLAELRN